MFSFVPHDFFELLFYINIESTK